MRLAVTGHRPDKLGGYDTPVFQHMERATKMALHHWLRVEPPQEVLCGMAQGFDQWVCEVCLHMAIPVVAAIPFEGQEKLWPPLVQQRYLDLLRCVARVVVVSPGEYEVWKMHARNRWMVDHADKVWALWDGTPGGTASCVQYACDEGKPVVNLWHKAFTPLGSVVGR